MKIVLFCYHPYSFGILKPLNDAALKRHYDVFWYVRASIAKKFPWQDQARWSSSISDIVDFQPDVLFVPGNEVPYFLRGVKVQVFHGLAGEKKGHFRIRDYFDLYLTQGPNFTRRFEALALEHGDFCVRETGWCKLDPLFDLQKELETVKNNLLKQHKAQKLILYAPTFSPSLTSAPSLFAQWEAFLNRYKDYLVVLKFHDLMDAKWKDQYKALFSRFDNALFVKDPDILQWLVMCDLMVSDTSSVVYECLLLDKPVLTFQSRSEQVLWQDFSSPGLLAPLILEELASDPLREQRSNVIADYHPFNDGQSSERMLDEVLKYIDEFGVPESRKLNLYRKFKIRKLFGRNS